MKRFHEAPKCIFKQMQEVTDGDYALVHLFETDPDYYRMFKEAVESGREVILDNSLFELGASFDPDRFAFWIGMLKPTYYVVPDVMDDGPANVKSFDDFRAKYPNLPGKTMGVVHGRSYEEFVECYKQMADRCDKICLSLDNPWWHAPVESAGTVYDHYTTISSETASKKWCREAMMGRVLTIHRMLYEGVIRADKPHHLLGVLLPQEMLWYNYDWIESVDTSNPVVHGMSHVVYDEHGLNNKVGTRMCEMMNAPIAFVQLSCIMKNVSRFKEFCDGTDC